MTLISVLINTKKLSCLKYDEATILNVKIYVTKFATWLYGRVVVFIHIPWITPTVCQKRALLRDGSSDQVRLLQG
jgi:hypothetical protein